MKTSLIAALLVSSMALAVAQPPVEIHKSLQGKNVAGEVVKGTPKVKNDRLMAAADNEGTPKGDIGPIKPVDDTSPVNDGTPVKSVKDPVDNDPTRDDDDPTQDDNDIPTVNNSTIDIIPDTHDVKNGTDKVDAPAIKNGTTDTDERK
ncbi:hypothetical protein BGZ72_003938 [Mortierella alpina]|nr:hypothetical protein BGZ72_003938 [Mortierella alpina]